MVTDIHAVSYEVQRLARIYKVVISYRSVHALSKHQIHKSSVRMVSLKITVMWLQMRHLTNSG